jgi:zinc transport system substrate-binding protein
VETGRSGAAQRLHVVTSFYPLEFAASRIAGGRSEVVDLTKPGGEPHDLELAPDDVARIADADLVVYLSGFQAATDDAVRQEASDHALDVAGYVNLNRKGIAEDGGNAPAVDPHFWLDPTRLAAIAGPIADRMSRLDPPDATTFRANAEQLRVDLATLDAEYRTGLATCRNRDIVTSHEAFGYLAQRYGLTQVGITGLSPEQEPDPATLARVTDFVRRNHVRTIYYETLVSPAIAKTVATETHARTAVLDPIEGITKTSAGRDYLAVMQANLAALKEGQPCP